MIDSPYLVIPGKKISLHKFDTRDTGPFKDKESAVEVTDKNLKKLRDLQEVFYAGAERSLLIVLQAMDAGGKDGAIESVFSGVNPQGCLVTSFKVPSTLEKAHDYLWRIHSAVPPRGMIGIFNRSHYESLLVERVHNITPKKVWSKRYRHINEFERMLVDEGTIILKFFLHISQDEQKERMEARLADPNKNWKFNPGDLRDRELWNDYQDAYEELLSKCSTEHAPWFIVPSDRKWFRNWLLSDTIVRTLKSLHLKYPAPAEGLENIKLK